MVNRQDDSKIKANYVHEACLSDEELNKGGEEHQRSE